MSATQQTQPAPSTTINFTESLGAFYKNHQKALCAAITAIGLSTLAVYAEFAGYLAPFTSYIAPIQAAALANPGLATAGALGFAAVVGYAAYRVWNA